MDAKNASSNHFPTAQMDITAENSLHALTSSIPLPFLQPVEIDGETDLHQRAGKSDWSDKAGYEMGQKR